MDGPTHGLQACQLTDRHCFVHPLPTGRYDTDKLTLVINQCTAAISGLGVSLMLQSGAIRIAQNVFFPGGEYPDLFTGNVSADRLIRPLIVIFIKSDDRAIAKIGFNQHQVTGKAGRDDCTPYFTTITQRYFYVRELNYKMAVGDKNIRADPNGAAERKIV